VTGALSLEYDANKRLETYYYACDHRQRQDLMSWNIFPAEWRGVVERSKAWVSADVKDSPHNILHIFSGVLQDLHSTTPVALLNA
jgi:hypothetical protein